MPRWKFDDGNLNTTYRMKSNPNSGGSPTFEKTLTYQSSPKGSPIVFEGRDKPRVFNVSGVLHEQAELDALNTWYDKRYQVKITDDLGRQFYVYIVGLKVDRAPLRNNPWRHLFNMRYIELDWPV